MPPSLARRSSKRAEYRSWPMAETGKEKKAMKDEAQPPNTAEGFARFKEMTRRIVAVPKAEIDEKAREYARARKKKRCVTAGR